MRLDAPVPGAPPRPARLVLRQWIEHKNPANLRLHVWNSGVMWLAWTTLLSRIPVPLGVPLLGANAGAWFAVLSVVGWLRSDALVAAAVALMTACWAVLPGGMWGQGHGVFGVLAPAAILGLSIVTGFYAHVFYHEHCEFLNGGPRLWSGAHKASSIVWAPFHFWLFGLLSVGWRPRLKARLDAWERRTLLRRSDVPWRNWARSAGCRARVVCVPQSTEDLIDVVREACREGRRLRVVGSAFSWSALVPTDDVLVFCQRLDRVTVDLSDPARPTVWAEAGVTNRQLNAELTRHGLAVPWNVVLENVRVGGIVSVGTHGSGHATSTMGDLIEALEVVDSEGRLRVLSEEAVGPDIMSAARVGLGLFGVIVRVKLRVVATHRVRQVDRRMPISAVLDRLPELVSTHDSIEVYWFPWNRDMWVRSFDRTDEPLTFANHGFFFSALNFAQNLWMVITSKLVQTLARRLVPAVLRFNFRMLTFRTRVLPLADAVHYRKWIETVPCGCTEVGFRMDPDGATVRRAFEMTERLVERYGRRGLYPMNLTLNIRFIGSSGALLSPAYESGGITCFIEPLCVGRPEGWDAFTADLCAEWLKLPGALPHWAKEFAHIPGVASLVRAQLGDRLTRFREALAASGIDPNHAFVNPLLERIFFDEPEAAVAPCSRPPSEPVVQRVATL